MSSPGDEPHVTALTTRVTVAARRVQRIADERRTEQSHVPPYLMFSTALGLDAHEEVGERGDADVADGDLGIADHGVRRRHCAHNMRRRREAV